MRRILELVKRMLSSEDLMDSELYIQHLGDPVSETGIPKTKFKVTVVKEDGNKAIISVTDIGQLSCGHWNIEITAQCVVCSSTWCRYCVSEKTAGFSCQGCGRFVCRSCAHVSLIDPEVALCGRCGFIRNLPSIIRRKLCKTLPES